MGLIDFQEVTLPSMNNLLWFPMYIFPIMFLCQSAYAILIRNPQSRDNRYASFISLMMALLFFLELIRNLLPIEQTLMLTSHLIYPVTLLVGGVSVLFHSRITHYYDRFSKVFVYGLTYAPVGIYCLYLIVVGNPNPISPEEQVSKMLQLLLGLLFLTMVVYSLLNLTLCILAWRNAKGRSEEKRCRVMMIGSGSYVLCAILLPMLLPSEITLPPNTPLYATLVWGIALRILMIRFDFLPSTERKYEMLFKMSSVTILLIDEHMVIREANPHARHLFGVESAGLVGQSLLRYIPTVERGALLEHFKSGVEAQEAANSQELVLFDHAGKSKSVLMDIHKMFVSGAVHALTIVRDMTARKEEEAGIKYLALHDSLTGLSNRYHFQAKLQQRLDAWLAGEQGLIAVLLIDLDRFKLLNDTLGHQYGDIGLQEISKRLADIVQGHHLVSRLGGDEFGILMVDCEFEKVIDMSERILHMMATPVTIEGQDFFLGASIGISTAASSEGNAALLLKNADIAMYRAKRNGGHQYCLFNREMNALLKRNVDLEGHLRKALEAS